MKLKGINPLERHVEKIILAIAVVVCLGVLALQILAPKTVEVGGQQLPPAEAFAPAERAAESLRAQLDSTEPALPEALDSSVTEAFGATLAQRMGPRPEVLALGEGISPGVAGELTGGGDVRYAEVEVPAPAEPVAALHQAAIDPREVVATPSLAEFLPAEQPFDIAAVSVQASFDGTVLRDRLVRDDLPEQGALRAIPRNWWRGGIQILAVELERERLQPDGSWSAPEIVPTPPGMPNLAAQLSGDRTALGDIQAMVDRARDGARSITQPVFYRTINSAPWIPPAQAAARAESGATGVDPEVVRLERRREDLASRAEALREQLDQSGQGGTPDPRDPGRPGRPGRDTPPPTRPGTPDADDPQRRALESRLERTLEELAEVEQQLADLGVASDEPATDDPNRPAPPTRGGDRDPAMPALLENPSLALWAHDLSARPGETYRYRVRAVVNNPFFGRRASLASEQQPLASEPTLAGSWSDWTQPVTVLGDRYYFITNAAPADELRGVRATAELYRFYYGQWRRASVTVEPGDRLADTTALPALPIYDLALLSGGTPTGDPAVPTPPDGGRDDFGAPTPPPAGRDVSDADLARAEVPGVDALAIETPAVMLDVAIRPGSAAGRGAEYQALLSDLAGGLLRRLPEQDRTSEIYRRISAAARAAEQQTARTDG